MTRIEAGWLGEARVRVVTAMLERAGYQALFVGGCVRDALLGREAADLDVATEARPDQVMVLAEAAGLKAVPTGIDHGTVTLVSDGRPIEVTTFRRDVSTDGRWAVVAFSSDVAEDARRRDFTMNALYAAPDGKVLDPVGEGLADLAAKHVRFVGEARRRIEEDRLRVLRFFRFHAWFGLGHPDAAALAACAEAAGALGALSRERVGAEVAKLLAAPDPAPSVAAMAEAGVLPVVLPGARADGLAPLIAVERAAGAAPCWRRRLAALAPDAARWADALRLSRADARAIRAIGAARDRAEPAAARAYRHGAVAARDAVLLDAAEGAALPPDLEEALAAGEAARFPLRGGDLPALAGPALGRELKRLESEWVRSGFRLDRAALRAMAGGD